VPHESVIDPHPRNQAPWRQAARRLAVRARLVGPALFCVTLLVVLVFALWPGHGGAPRLFGWDKLEHMSAFAALSLIGRFAFPGLNRVWLVLALTALGAAIELLQMTPMINRIASLSDMAANTVGIMAGLVAAHLAARMARALDIHP